ncbi:MAG: tetratricopeptide repeat protein [Candidatus Hodarchaeota archaeon]
MFEKRDAFISYSRLDKNFAEKLAQDLMEVGITIWIDRSDIVPATRWDQSIQTAIANCSVMLAIISPNYVRSEICQDELSRAADLGKAVFPILINYLDDPSHWPIRIERVQYMDFTNWETAHHYLNRLPALVQKLKPHLQGDTENNEQSYLNTLIEEVSNRVGPEQYIDLFVLVDKSDTKGSSNLHPLDKLAPFINDLSKSHTKKQTRRQEKSETERLDKIRTSQAVRRYSKFVLLGEPGAGKTVTISHQAREAAQQRRNNPLAPLPVLIALTEWEGKYPPLGLVHSKLGFLDEKTLRHELRSGGVLLFLDGLNEMGIEREKKTKVLKDFIHRDVRNVIVSCRKGDYTSSLDLNLPIVRIERLDPHDIGEFAQKYLAEQAEPFLKQILPQSENLSNETSGWHGLAKNPLLLKLLMVSYREFGGDLPTNRGGLFKALITYLLSCEKDKGSLDFLHENERDLFISAVIEALAKLAFVMTRQMVLSVQYDFALREISDKSWLLPLTPDEKKKANQILYMARSANLIEFIESTEKKMIRFYHHLMQEYFAAVKLKNMPSAGVLKDEAVPFFDVDKTEDVFWLPIVDRYEGWWDQVVIALYGIIDEQQTDAFLGALVEIDPHLAARCVVTDPQRTSEFSEESLQNLIDTLMRALCNPSANDLFWTGAQDLDYYSERWLDEESGDKQRLKKLIPNKWDWVRRIAARALAFLGRKVVPDLIEIMRNANGEPFLYAAMSLITIGHPAIRDLLQIAATEEEKVRQMALQCITEIIKDNPSVITKLINNLNNEINTNTVNPVYYLQKGDLLAIQKNHQDALVAYARALELNPSYPNAFAGMFQSYIDLKENNRALEVYKNAVKHQAQTTLMCLDIGDLLWDQDKDNKEGVLKAFQLAQESDSKSVEVFIAIGDLYNEDKNYENAFESYKRAAVLEPKNVKVQSQLASFLMSREKYEDAIVTYRRALNLSYESIGRNWEGIDIGNLGVCYERIGDTQKAIECYKKALTIAREVHDKIDEALWLSNLAYCYENLRDWQKAIEYFKLHLQVARDSSNQEEELKDLVDLERCFVKIGIPKRAIELSKQALHLAQDLKNQHEESVACGAIGLSLLDLGQIEEAKKFCSRALQIAIETEDELRKSAELDNVGSCLYYMGEIKNAIKHHEKALRLAEKHADKHAKGWICFNLAAIFVGQSNYKEAIKYAETGARLGTDIENPTIVTYSNIYLALANLAKGNLVAARNAIGICVKYQLPKTAHRVQVIVGIIELRRGNTEKAKEAFKRALSEADSLLEITKDYYQPLESKGLAYCGLAAISDNSHIQDAIAAYTKARSIARAEGITKQALFIFDLLAIGHSRDLLGGVRTAIVG